MDVICMFTLYINTPVSILTIPIELCTKTIYVQLGLMYGLQAIENMYVIQVILKLCLISGLDLYFD